MDPGDCCIIGKDKCSCVFPLALSKPLQSSQPGTGGCHLSRLQPRSPSYIPLHKKAPATSQGDTSNPRRVEAGLPKPHTPHAFRKPTNTKEIKPPGVQALLSALLFLYPAFSRDLLLELMGLAPIFILFPLRNWLI